MLVVRIKHNATGFKDGGEFLDHIPRLVFAKPAGNEKTQACAGCFARGDLSSGARHLKDMIDGVPTHDLDETLIYILGECAAGLAEYGGTRFEYILLSLHTLDIALRQCQTLDTFSSRTQILADQR